MDNKKDRNNIFHDLNNLLMIIQGNLAILRMDLTGDEEHTQEIDQAYKASLAAANLIKKLTVFSETESSQSTMQSPKSIVTGLHGNETILIVEDEDNLRNLTAKYLQSLGYHVLQAENGESALQTLQNDHQIKLLLTDIIMPGTLTGTDLVKNSLTLNPDLKIIYMSGYTNEVLQRDYQINNELYPILLKPFSRSDLAILLRNLLSSTSQSSAHTGGIF